MRAAVRFSLVLALVAAAPPAEARQECTDYARGAISQVQQAAQRGCLVNGPRWSTDEGLHYGFCEYSYEQAQVSELGAETLQRELGLSACPRANSAAARPFE